MCDGNYYVYGTGRGISVLTSSNGFDWQRGSRVFDHIPDSVHQYCPKNDGANVWAPDIIQLNGEYYLYYAISSYRANTISAVGLLTSPMLDPNSPAYKWTDRGMIVHSSEGEDLNAIDPGVVHAPRPARCGSATVRITATSSFGGTLIPKPDCASRPILPSPSSPTTA